MAGPRHISLSIYLYIYLSLCLLLSLFLSVSFSVSVHVSVFLSHTHTHNPPKKTHTCKHTQKHTHTHTNTHTSHILSRVLICLIGLTFLFFCNCMQNIALDASSHLHFRASMHPYVTIDEILLKTHYFSLQIALHHPPGHNTCVLVSL